MPETVTPAKPHRETPVAFLRRANRRLEAIKGRVPEKIALLLYVILHLVISRFHEPWYDEATAWQIARISTWKEILFVMPGYEGHPPLWHLVLAPFAKLGAPYELSLTLVSLVFAGAAVALLLWYAPFPRVVKLLLPFTYFFFYQYGVISRPYCMMLLAFMLLAMAHTARNEKPGRYVLALVFLCATSAYGIVFSGGLAIAWLWELWHGQNVAGFVKGFVRDRRFAWLAGLLVYALALIRLITPPADATTASILKVGGSVGTLAKKFILFFLVAPGEVTCTDVLGSEWRLSISNFSLLDMGGGIVVGAAILAAFFWFGRRKGMCLTFFVPYTLFCVFASIVYSYRHHLGIALLLMVFWLWAALNAPNAPRKTPAPAQKKKKAVLRLNGREKTELKALCVAGIAWMLGVSLYWTGASCVNEGKLPYSIGRDMAVFIKQNHLEQYSIMAPWAVEFDEDENVIYENTNSSVVANIIAPYFDKNIFYNVRSGVGGSYVLAKQATDEENAARKAEWQAKGYPDIVCMGAPLALLFGEDAEYEEEYRRVYSQIDTTIWKDRITMYHERLWLRAGLLEEAGLEEVPEEPIFQFASEVDRNGLPDNLKLLN